MRLQGDMNNNKMERMNGEMRDREKTMRGFKENGFSNPKGVSVIPQLY